MPPKKKTSPDAAEKRRSAVAVKRLREGRRSEFSSGALHATFEAHVTAAQSAFLRGEAQLAEHEATQALRIRPTAHLFALLAVIAESKGKFHQASDFRLLQAFMARDIILWEELLQDFMSQQLFYKSVVCLQRMSVLEKDPVRNRALQLQLADLLIGLGEIARASKVLVPLWNCSRCRDFEVFALLSSLYFQLGKWSSLQRLIESSINHAFRAQEQASASTTATPTAATAAGADDGAPQKSAVAASPADPPAPGSALSPQPAGSSKRVRFAGMDEEVQLQPPSPPSLLSPTAAPLDEFSFDDVLPSPASPASSAPPSTLSLSSLVVPLRALPSTAARPDGVVHQLYGEHVALPSTEDKQNFLTLINVHAELLNEQGTFEETVQLLHMAACCLEVELMELPPDLLVRLGVAYAFLGGVYEQPCRDVFQHLIGHCSMDEYGDVLLDAATSLQKVSMHAEAAQLYMTLARYHQFVHDRLRRQVSAAEAELALVQDTASVSEVHAATEALKALKAEEADLRTVLAAALQGQAQSAYAQGLYEEARALADQVLQLEPTHLQARLLLGRYHFYQRQDTATAAAVLTPTEHEPALQRIQLGVFLVQVFQRARRYVEAIALGVSIFELLLSSEEDGDTQSVAPSSAAARRSRTSLFLPTMTRASSAILPAGSLAGMVRGGGGSSAAGGGLARTASLAASIKASTSVARQQLSRRGMESLTTTAYGASAAASVAAGWDRREGEPEAPLKDASTIFRFTRRRGPRATPAKGRGGVAPEAGEKVVTAAVAVEEGEGDGPAAGTAAEKRRAAVVTMSPSDFWATPAGEAEGPDAQRVKTEQSPNESVSVEKTEEASSDAVNEAVAAPPVPPPPAKRTRSGSAAAAPESAPPAGKTRAAARKRSKAEEVPVRSNNTVVGERDRDLAELEEFLTTAEVVEGVDGSTVASESSMTGPESASAESGAAETPSESFALPSLEEVSRQFNDPTMAELFLAASSFAPGGGVRGSGADGGGGGGSGGDDDARDPWAELVEAGGADLDRQQDKVTLREAVAVLGQTGFIALAVAVVDCYSAIGQFTEAREFAFVSLSHFSQKRRLHRVRQGLERPLRLAVLRAALAAGESEDAYRVGLRLLQEDTAEEKRCEVMELMHSVLSRCYDRSSILYRAVADGYNEPALLVLLANRYYETRSYTRVLNLYLMALRERPSDVLLHFMVGLSYLFCSHQKRTRAREECVSAATYYLTRYQQLRLAVEPGAGMGEVLYNMARALQFLRLYHLCIPLYERVAYDLVVPGECTVSLQRAARVNLYFLYRWVSGNRTLALSALQPRDEAMPARSPSPFGARSAY